MPHVFFMAFAPLDVWVRIFRSTPCWIGPRYWLRLAFYLLSSTFGTIISLPERVAFWLYDRFVPFNPQNLPGPVFVLGYYRSGTTHLQNLLSCDPNLYTPRLYQASLPQGFMFSWAFLRLTMIGFMPTRRPMDDVGVGIEFPAEDQFGVLNWGSAGTMPGRSVFPRAIAYYRRYHAPEQLTPAEYGRWRRYQLAFIRKMSLLARQRRLLLKSPSHTALVPDLLELLRGAGPIKFIHISRHPKEVIESNLNLHRRFYARWSLQDAIDDETLLDYLASDYEDTERRYLEARDAIGPGNIAEIRYEDLCADPVGELRKAYRTLGLEFSDRFERQLNRYLAHLQTYRPGTAPADSLPDRAETVRLDFLIARFGHDRPATVAGQSASPTVGVGTHKELIGGIAALLTGLACTVLWLLLTVYSSIDSAHFNRLVWPTGLLVGYVAWRIAGSGSQQLGAWTAAVTLLMLLAVNSISAAFQLSAAGDVTWASWAGTVHNTLYTTPTMFWGFIAVLSAYRLGTHQALPWH